MDLVAKVVALSEVAAFACLIVRGRTFDRINAGILLPFLVQSSLQVMLWRVIDHQTDGASCGLWSSNWTLSLVQLISIIGMPYYWAWLHFVECTFIIFSSEQLAKAGLAQALQWSGLDSADVSKAWPRRRLFKQLQSKIRTAAANTVLFFLVFLVLHGARSAYPKSVDWDAWYLSWCFPGPICTTRGPFGFQAWPMAVFANWAVKYVFLLAFGCVGSIYNYIPHPSLMPLAVEMCSLFGFVLVIVFDVEWASLWSLGAICMFPVALLEPFLFRYSRVLDAEALAPEGEMLRKSLIFRMAWHRFDVFHLVPWGDAVQKYEEDAGTIENSIGSRDISASDHGGISKQILNVPVLMTM